MDRPTYGGEHMSMTHRALMVPAQFAELARSLAAAFEPVSGAGMFRSPVYDTEGVVQFYCSNGLIQDEYAALLDDPTGDKLWAAVQKAGAQIPEAAVRQMMQNAIVRSDCNVLDIVAEKGLAGHHNPKGEPL